MYMYYGIHTIGVIANAAFEPRLDAAILMAEGTGFVPTLSLMILVCVSVIIESIDCDGIA